MFILSFYRRKSKISLALKMRFHCVNFRDIKPILVNLYQASKIKYANNIILLRLEERLDYSKGQGLMPICLPQTPYKSNKEMKVWISGYSFHSKRNVADSSK